MSQKAEIELLTTTKISLSDLSRLTKIRRQTISERLEYFNLQSTTGAANSKLFNLADILTLFFTVVQTDEDADLSGEDRDRALLLRAQREIAELKSQKMKGELVPLADVMQVVGSEYNQVRTQFVSLGDSLCRELAVETDPEIITEIIREKVNSIFMSLQADVEYGQVEKNELGD